MIRNILRKMPKMSGFLNCNIPFNRSFAYLETKYLRNIGISAHIDTGKTTMTERVLYFAGRISDIHEVKGNDEVGAKMDFMELEKERGITIRSAATNVKWNNCHLNIIDTPGHVDFTIEVERALRVLDGAILLVCGVSGVQPQTVTVDRQMKRYEVPKLIFINKLDRLGGNGWKTLETIKKRLGCVCAAVNMPIGVEDKLNGVVDLIQKKAFYFEGAKGTRIIEKEIPESLKELTEQKRKELIETLADVDDELGEAYLAEATISSELIKKAIRKATIARKFSPVFMGSALKNIGVQLVLDGVCDYLPAPYEVKNYGFNYSHPDKPKVEMIVDDKKEFVGYAFKLDETKFGQLTYMRVYQGKIRKGDYVTNTNGMKRVKVSRMVRMHADEMEDISECGAGDIFGLFGVECNTGDTFTGSSNIQMQSMHVPDPVMSLTIKPGRKDEITKFMKALRRFQREDPTFVVKFNDESEEVVISGMGELHLNIYAERMRREYGIHVGLSSPTVNYRETISARAHFNYLHKKQTGGAGQFARVIGYLEPIPATEGVDRACQFVDNTKGSNLPHEFIPPVQKAFLECIERGPQTGFPVVGVRYVLTDGEIHTVDSSSHAFSIAAKASFREAFQDAGPIILEPLMTIEVIVPLQYQNQVLGQLIKRRCQITKTQGSGEFFTINGEIPLSRMFGYSGELRGATQGTGEFSMEYKTHQIMEEFEADQVRIANEKFARRRK